MEQVDLSIEVDRLVVSEHVADQKLTSGLQQAAPMAGDSYQGQTRRAVGFVAVGRGCFVSMEVEKLIERREMGSHSSYV